MDAFETEAVQQELTALREKKDALKDLVRELWISGKNASQRLPKDSIDRIRLENALKAVNLHAQAMGYSRRSASEKPPEKHT